MENLLDVESTKTEGEDLVCKMILRYLAYAGSIYMR